MQNTASARLFSDDDVDSHCIDNPKRATVLLTLPEDAGPKGEVLKLVLRLWVSFEPSPSFGDGFERGKTVPVLQPLYFCVYKRGSSRFMLRDIEDHTSKTRLGYTLAAPFMTLPLLMHKRGLQRTEDMLKGQVLGWNHSTS